TIEQACCLLGIGHHQVIKGYGSIAWIINIRRKRRCLIGWANGSGNKARFFGGGKLCSSLSSYSCSGLVDLIDKRLSTIVCLRDTGYVKCVCLVDIEVGY